MEMIMATDEKGWMGIDNQLPWYLPEDLQYFRKMTKNAILVMGRKTWESLPQKPLGGNRIHLVLSRNPPLFSTAFSEFVFFVSSLESLQEKIQEIREKRENLLRKIMVIGGCEIYRLLLDKCTVIHWTKVDWEKGEKRVEEKGGEQLTKCYFPFTMEELREKGYECRYTSDILISKNQSIRYQYHTLYCNLFSNI
jgi:dihydrofolate reductase